jgi:PIN domain nuclease of toxin-antitoxin system
VTLPDAVLLDTCAIIWLAEAELTPSTVEALDRAAATGGVFVSPVSAWEIGFLSNPRGRRPKLQLLPSPSIWFAKILNRPEIRQAPLTATAALNASYLPEPLHGDPADRLLIATAREMNAALATGDEDILAYAEAGHVKVLPC